MTNATAYALALQYPGLTIKVEADGTWEARGPLEGVTAARNAA